LASGAPQAQRVDISRPVLVRSPSRVARVANAPDWHRSLEALVLHQLPASIAAALVAPA
jgi:hypothetical protein